ncbi:MAG TPA: DUF2271 domain-containing protein [Bryobacteraceae bacterium]|nr:DUF2271 domain-containing protein [Bryobacteraceae bacterium]
MKPLSISLVAALALAAAFAGGSHFKTTPWRTAHFENVLGTSMEMKVHASSEETADRAETAAMTEIKRLNSILSGYDPSSEFSRWASTRGIAVPVSPDLMHSLRLWDDWRVRSGGALNPAAEAITRVWTQAESTGKLPSEPDMTAAARAASERQWALEGNSGSAMRLTDTPIRLNSFTKSYIIESAAATALRTSGVSGVVVNIGGDLVVRGDGSEQVNVADPRSDTENSDPIAVLDVKDRAVATSGDYRRGFDIGGRHFSHIVDPRTGRTADAIISATVVAPQAVDAGALATAFCVLTPEESRKLAATVPGVEYLLIAKDGAQITTSGWNALRSPVLMAAASAPQTRQAAPSANASLWNPDYELTIDLEVPQTRGFGARRPYVAAWIEDKDRYPVRTLAVWFEKTRWLNELHAWYRDDRLRAMSEGHEILNSVTSATRSPGKYSLKWDGKDNSGKLVKAGHYTVLVEAAREHGGYTLDKRDMDFNGAPSRTQAPADAELGPVTFDYHKVAR